jgi:hypothetical protein
METRPNGLKQFMIYPLKWARSVHPDGYPKKLIIFVQVSFFKALEEVFIRTPECLKHVDGYFDFDHSQN